MLLALPDTSQRRFLCGVAVASSIPKNGCGFFGFSISNRVRNIPLNLTVPQICSPRADCHVAPTRPLGRGGPLAPVPPRRRCPSRASPSRSPAPQSPSAARLSPHRESLPPSRPGSKRRATSAGTNSPFRQAPPPRRNLLDCTATLPAPQLV
jgi:hypothetical protein